MTSCLLAGLALLYPTTAQGGPKPLMRDFIGINTHTVQFKTDLYKPVARLLRDYHPVGWDLLNETSKPAEWPMSRESITFKERSGKVNWDELYSTWTKLGYDVLASVMFESIKPEKWSDAKKDTYEYAKSFAKYFGPSGSKKSVKTMEIGNEPADWTEEKYVEIFQSMAKGIREGDPKMKIATCAVADGKHDKYSKDANILKSLIQYVDVLNIHTYAFLEYWPTWKRTYPEDSKSHYLKQVTDMIAWRDKNALGRQIWVTEFGWDSSTKPNLKDGDFAKFMGNSDKEQAQYLVRSFLVFSGLAVDRAYMFWFNDEDAPTLHASSGLTRDYKPKPSFHAQAHLLKSLGNYRFERVLVQKPGEAYVYQFAAEKGREKVIVAWSPTGGGKSGNVSVPAKGYKITKSEKMPLKEGAAGSAGGSIDASGNLTIAIDESPSYIWLNTK